MGDAILATSPFLALGALACPVGMGAMMWFMMRGSRSQSSLPPAEQPSTLDELRREHERLGAQIEGLQDAQSADERIEEPAAGSGPRSTLAAGTRATLE
jgi:hypothetical protein